MPRRTDTTSSRRFPTGPGDEIGMWHLVSGDYATQTWCDLPVSDAMPALTLPQAMAGAPAAGAPDCQVCLTRYGMYRVLTAKTKTEERH